MNARETMLRVAVACRSGDVAVWQQRCIDMLFASGFAKWIAIIDTSDLCEPHSHQPPLFNVPALRMAPIRFGAHRPLRIKSADAAMLRGELVDAILSFDRSPELMLAGIAGRGIWGFQFGDETDTEEPPCYWESYRGDAVERVRLLQRDGTGAVTVLREGAMALSPVSLRDSVESAVHEAATWPALVCRAIASGARFNGAAHARITHDHTSYQAHRANAMTSMSLHAKYLRHRLARVHDAFFVSKWNVGIVDAPIEQFINGAASAWPPVEWLPEPPGDDYRADPFGATGENGDAWVFVEHFDAKASRGRIEACATTAGAWSPDNGDAISAPDHLSYPFMLHHEGAWYCIPESLGQHQVSLYRAVEMPRRWEKVATLIEMEAVDATIVRHQDRWWLFCTDYAKPRHHRLHAFYADDLRGPYLSHALNPVKVDPRSAGCAGTPFVENGILYRPAQDCSRSYGGAVVLNRVLELTPTSFREEPAAVVLPHERYPLGVHTLSAMGRFTLVDGKRKTFTLRRAAWRLSTPLRRLLARN